MNEGACSLLSLSMRFVQCRQPQSSKWCFGAIVPANRHRCHNNIFVATRIARRYYYSSPSCVLPLGVSSTTRLLITQPPTAFNSRMTFSTNNTANSSSSSSNSNDDLDSLCNKLSHDNSINNISIEEFAQGCKFLHQIALGNIVEVRTIVASRSNIVNFRDYDRRTPLHIAASEGHLSICQYLISHGSRINRSDRWGGSPLDDAHRHRHTNCVDYLRSVGGKFGSSSQSTNFITASSEGDVEEVRTLLSCGNIDINMGDYDNRTALHVACSNGHVDIVTLLCASGADVNVEDRWGGKPLDDASFIGHRDCIDILTSYGAKYGKAQQSVEREALFDLFEQYAKIRDGNMTLDWEDVKALLQGIGQEPKDWHVRNLFRIVDEDNNGLIDKEEFIEQSDLFLQGSPARIILVVGGPGSGKGVLSERLVKECGVVHLSSGNLLREEVEAGTLLGKQVESIMKSGGLVSSAIMVALMQKKMKDYPGKRILLDGFPRSAENARDLVALCGKPELALHVDCHDTVLIERILSRGKTGGRVDDNIHTALERIRTYHKYHQLTLDFLREQRVPIVNLDGSATAEGVWEQLRAVGRLMRKAVGQNTSVIDSKGKGGGIPISVD